MASVSFKSDGNFVDRSINFRMSNVGKDVSILYNNFCHYISVVARFRCFQINGSLSISPFSALENLNKLFAFNQDDLYFLEQILRDQLSLKMESDTGFSGILRLLMIVKKKLFKTFAVLVSVLMISYFLIKTIFFHQMEFFMRKKRLTVFQKGLLSIIFLVSFLSFS